MGYRPSSRVDALLEELCAKYGYCIPPNDRARLNACPPMDPARFADEVLQADGLDPSLMEESVRNALVTLVDDWLHGQKGIDSGLPLDDTGD